MCLFIYTFNKYFLKVYYVLGVGKQQWLIQKKTPKEMSPHRACILLSGVLWETRREVVVWRQMEHGEWNQSEKWWTLFIEGGQEKPLWWMVFQQRPEGGEGMSELSICGGNSTWDRSLLGSCSTARRPAWRGGWIRVQEALQRLGHVGPFRFWLVFGVLFCVRRETIARLWT